MKQILFRAKRIGRIDGFCYRSQYQNGDWVYGLITKQYPLEWQDKLYDEMTDIYGVSGIEIDRETVGQFTGLCDKNGNKIFEGDILETAGPDGADYQDVVHFGHFNDDDNHGNEYIGFYVKSGNYTTSLLEMPLGKHNYCYVIGNIYDNPELLEDIK